VFSAIAMSQVENAERRQRTEGLEEGFLRHVLGQSGIAAKSIGEIDQPVLPPLHDTLKRVGSPAITRATSPAS
jgi:hypothetical protein